MVGSFEGESKSKSSIHHEGKLQTSGEERAQNARATVTAGKNDDPEYPKYTLTLDGGPFTAPCSSTRADGMPREAVFTFAGCAVKTKNFEGKVDISGAVKLDPADELVGILGGDAKSNGDEVHFHFDLRAKRKAK
jgi:hypothetical protein